MPGIIDAVVPAAIDDEEVDIDANGAEPTSVEFLATGGAGQRLDRYLAEHLPALDPMLFDGLSRARIQRWISLGAVRVDGVVRPSKTQLSGIESIRVQPQPQQADLAFRPEPVSLAIVHEDSAILVIDKPAGLVVHPAAGNWSGTLLNGLLHYDPTLAQLPRAGIVHRLDKDTSGLLVVARTEAARQRLAEQLADRSMGRLYLALTSGRPAQAGSIELPIGRDPRSRLRMAAFLTNRPAGSGDALPAGTKRALTDYRVLASGKHGRADVALVQCRLQSGRTHQIRVHLAALGFPLLGDTLYGGPRLDELDGQALHAITLELVHPLSGDRRRWSARPPVAFQRVASDCGIELPHPHMETWS